MIFFKKKQAERHLTMKKKCLTTFILALILSVNFIGITGKAAPSPSPSPSATSSQKSNTEDSDKKPGEFPVPNAQSAIVIDTRSGKTIYELDANKKVYPAGLTNIMTAMIVLENMNPADSCEVTKEALANVTTSQHQLGLKAGESYTVEQLLHAIILNSNNDASNALAIAVSGNIDEFVNEMNKKADELGLKNTHFVNPTGLHNENHYTTAADMAKLSQYAMKNQVFAKIAATPKYTFSENKSPLSNSNYLVSSYKYPYHFYSNATGLKSGNSSDAGYCLAATAVKDNLSILSVIMGAQNADVKDKAYSYKDTVAIFNHIFENYKSALLVKKGEVIHDSKVEEAKNSTRLALTVEEDIYATLKKDANVEDVQKEIKITAEAKAPIEKGQRFGTVTYSYNGNKLATVDIVAANEVKRDFILHLIKSVLGFIFHPIVVILVAGAVYIYVKLRIARNKRRRMRRSKMVSMNHARTTSRGTPSRLSRPSSRTAEGSRTRSVPPNYRRKR